MNIRLKIGPFLALACLALLGSTKSDPAQFFTPWPAPLQGSDPDFVSTQDVVYWDGRRRWLAPVGTKTDGASIPQAALSFIGDRYDHRWRAAALVHDAYCGIANKNGVSYHQASWRDVHKMYYNACLAGNTPLYKAKLMYAAVWLFGPTWPYAELRRPYSSKRSIDLDMAIDMQDIELERQQEEIAALNIAEVDTAAKRKAFNQVRQFVTNDTLTADLTRLNARLLETRRALHASNK